MPAQASISAIYFHFEQSGQLTYRRRLKLFIGQIFKKEKTPFETLTCIFCSDKRLLEINRSFLHHNYLTDIITFNLAGKGMPVEGELYISLDRVRDNALTLHEYHYRELHRVIFHGVLHLCGYNDKTPADTALMRKKEDYYLHLYFGRVPRKTVSV